MSSDKQTMIMVTPSGARRKKADHPWIPMSPEEVAVEAKLCVDAGAGAIHIHVRGDDEGHSLDAERYRATIAAIKAAVGDELLMQITTEAVGMFEPPAQMAVVREIVPESASFGLRELVPDEAHEEEAHTFFNWVKDAGIIPQFLIYEPSELPRFKYLCDQGIIPFKRPFSLFAIGYHGKKFGEPEDVQPFVAALDELDFHPIWGACAFGRREADCVIAAYQAGGHIRVGFENNIEAPDGTPVTSNAASVKTVVERLAGFGVSTMTAPEIRSYLRANQD